MPQLLGSFEVLTHAVPQLVSPAGQVQLPLTHVAPVGQTCPHIPQLFVSFTLTHVPEQNICPGPQAHAPAEHISFAGHTLPHIPQFCGSVNGLTQVVPQRISPVGHIVVVVVVEIVVVVVELGGTTGAQRNFDTPGCTTRVPNWSVTFIGGWVLLGHLTW